MVNTNPINISTDVFITDGKIDFPTTKILVAGDLFCGGRAEKYLMEKEIDILWGDIVSDLSKHDVRIVNLENPLTSSQSEIIKSGPSLKANPLCATGISAGGFNVVTIANNHLKDMGIIGVLDTIRYCQEAGLYVVGAGINLNDATKPLILTMNDIRIAILAIAEGEFSLAETDEPGVWPLDLIDNFYQIQNARENADFVLVIFHGGVEFYPLPTPDMVKICRYFVNAGANSVICHHIHVPSGYEIYKDSPIIYSTGNFLFDWGHRMPPEGYMGYLVSLEIMPNAVLKFRLIPYFQCKDGFGVRRMKGSDLDEFLRRMYTLSDLIQDPAALDLEFKQLVKMRKNSYLAKAMLLSNLEQKLLNKGIWPFWRADKKRLAKLRNQFVCRTHQTMMIHVLKEELEHLKQGED